jgi:uncharacterized membrane protein YeiH
MTGLKKRMDIFGVVILGLVTAVGGGVFRDVILGNTPPKIFQDPLYALISVFISVVIFLRPIRRLLQRQLPIYEKALTVMDALGLGIFTVVGIRVAFDVSPDFSAFLLVFVGVVTGAGGGLTRDILAGDTPYIFVKHIYAVASLIGALACVMLWRAAGSVWAMLTGTVIIVVIRLLSAHFRWNLPRAEEPGVTASGQKLGK